MKGGRSVPECCHVFWTDVLLALLTEEFFYKPLTVAHTLVLHTFKPRTHSGDQASLLGTHEQSRCPDNLQPPRSSHRSGSTLVEYHFCRHDGFSQSDNFSLTTIQKREYLRWNNGYSVHLNPGGVTDCLCSWAPWIACHFVPHCFRDKHMLNDVRQ